MNLTLEGTTLEETQSTREWSATDLVAKELLQGLSNAQQQILVYDGPTCKFNNVAENNDAGSSQSTCLVVALSFARSAFDLERKGSDAMGWFARFSLTEELVEEMFAVETINKCFVLDDALLAGPQSVENLIELPPFRDAFSKVLLVRNDRSYTGIMAMLQQMWDNAPHTPIVAGVITYLQETILCLRVQFSGVYIYAILDPHIRQRHPHGLAFILNTSREATATYLQQLWGLDLEAPPHDEEDEAHLFSGHILLRTQAAAKSPTEEVSVGNESQSSPTVNSETTEQLATLSDSSKPIDTLEEPPSPLPNGTANGKPVDHVSTKNEIESSSLNNVKQSPAKSAPLRSSVSRNRLQQEFGWQMSLQSQKKSLPIHQETNEETESENRNEDSLPSKTAENKVEEEHATSKENILAKELQNHTEDSQDTAKQAKIRSPRARTAHAQAASSSSQASSTRNLAKKDIGWQLALQQMAAETKSEAKVETKAEASPKKAEVSPTKVKAKSANAAFSLVNNRRDVKAKPRGQQASQTQSLNPRKQPPRDDFGWQMALSAKTLSVVSSSNYNDDESMSQSDQWGSNLAETSPTQQTLGAQEDKSTRRKTYNMSSFKCAVCLETHDRDEIAEIPDCEHVFCRDCLRNHIQSKLEDRRYPIDCPACAMDRNRTERGHVDQDVVQLLGLSQAESDIFQELQLSADSVELLCPKCHNTMSIDRQEEKILNCTSYGCGQRWCKACRKEIDQLETNHTCKVTKLDRSLRRKGWRACTGCQTLVHKESGCNHLICKSPGCQTHFCYKCGASIVDGSTGQDVAMAVAAHYLTCTHFDKPAKCAIQ